MLCAQPLDQHIFDKIFGCFTGKIFIELQHDKIIHAHFFDMARFNAKRCQAKWVLFGHENHARMGLERQHDPRDAVGFSDPSGLANNLAMPQVHAVKVSNCNCAPFDLGRQVFKMSKYAHKRNLVTLTRGSREITDFCGFNRRKWDFFIGSYSFCVIEYLILGVVRPY